MKKFNTKTVLGKITLIAIVMSLVVGLLVPQVALGDASPKTKLDLRGWSKQNNQWEQGHLKGYREGDWVDFRLDFEGFDGDPKSIDITFDYMKDKNSNIKAYTEAKNFNLTVTGAVYEAGDSGVFTISDKSISKDNKKMTYTITINKKDMLKAIGDFTIYFKGHISDNARQWPGAFHVGRGGGTDTVPVNSKELIPPKDSTIISGYKFNDLNGDGNWDDGELGIKDWTIYLKPDQGEQVSITTDEDGYYEFSGIAPGTYIVSEKEEDGWTRTTQYASYTITTLSGLVYEDKNFGNFEEPTPKPSVSLTKTASPTAVKVGDTITYTYTIENDGNVELTNITLTDDKIGSISLSPTTLAAGATMTATATVTAAQEGTLTNVATVTGKYDNQTITDEAQATVLITKNGVTDPELGKIKIIKTAVEDIPVYYTMNNSETPGQPLAGAEFIIKDSDGEVVDTLTTGEGGIATSKDLPYGDYTVAETEAPVGYILDFTVHEVTIDAENSLIKLEIKNYKKPEDPDWQGAIWVQKMVSDYLPLRNSVSVMNSSGLYSPKGFTFTLTDRTDYTETVTTDEDGIAQFAYRPAGTYYLTEATREDYHTTDIPEGGLEIILNEETAPVKDDYIKFILITNIYNPEHPPTPKPGMSLTKTASPTRIKVGGKVTYTFVVKNTGDLPLFDVTLYDDKLDETIEIGDLEEGQEVTITKEYTTRTIGTLVNNAEVKGYYNEGACVTD